MSAGTHVTPHRVMHRNAGRAHTPEAKYLMARAKEGGMHSLETLAEMTRRSARRGNNPTPPEIVERILDMRDAGYTYKEIGAAVGYSGPGVLKVIQRVRGEL